MTKMLHAWFMDSCGYFEQCFGRQAGPGVKREIYQAIMAGMRHETIMAIMDEAEKAPRPSWAYSLFILHRCLDSGILTLADWQRDQREREKRKQRSNPALQYQQRDYTEEDFEYFDYEKFYGQGATK